jgi:tripeptidyl-peptidase-1
MTPDCIRALYDLPSPVEVAKSYDSDPVNSVGVFEAGSIYIPKDLDRFFKKFAPNIPAGTRPKFDSIEGADLKLNITLKSLSGEANIDLDIIYSLTYPQTITYVLLSTLLSERCC